MGGKTVSYSLTKILPSSSGLNLSAELTVVTFCVMYWPVDLPGGLMHECVRTCLKWPLTVLPGGACSLLSWKCVMQKEHQRSGSRVPAVRVAVSPNNTFR